MDDPRDREILAYYPYVVVRLGCDRCTRKGAFRLARLAAKFGPDITLDQLITKLVAAECPFWKTRHPYHGTCRARLIDLDGLREVPDLPPAILKLPDVARTAAALAKRAREAGLTESAQALEVAALAVKSYLDVGSERVGGPAPDRSSSGDSPEDKKQV
jgi:hypothetical protein